MKFLGTTTVIAPIVLIILTIWMAFAFASPASASPLPDKYYRDEMPTAYRGAWCQTPKPNVGAESGWMFTSDIRLDGSTLTMKDE